MRILSAVTTCVKRPQYLPATLESLHDAGFDPIVITDNLNRGSWPTFKRALFALVVRADKPDAVAIFQDDILIARGMFSYLEENLWPSPLVESIGVVSLYTAAVNHRDDSGWYTMSDLPHDNPFGALAYVLPIHVAEWIVWRDHEPAILTGADTVIGNLCRDKKLEYWMHSPSFVKHMGVKSAINDAYELIADKPFGLLNRQCRDFCDDVAKL